MKIFLLLLIAGASSAIHINCQFWKQDWGVIGQIYFCQVTSMDFTNNSTHITSYSGIHFGGNSSADVKGIIFASGCQNFNLTTVPKGFLNIFPNLIALNFQACPINSLNGDELDEYQKVEYWLLWLSQVTRVPGNFFASTPNMKFVYFGNNQIAHVGFGLLDNLQNLEQAWFEENVCINQIAFIPSKIPALIQALRQNCPDIEPETTTTSTTTTNQPPKCEIGDLEDFVCGLEEEVEVLQGGVKDLKESNKDLRSEVEELNAHVGELKAENEEIRAHLYELERIVLELTSRP